MDTIFGFNIITKIARLISTVLVAKAFRSRGCGFKASQVLHFISLFFLSQSLSRVSLNRSLQVVLQTIKRCSALQLWAK